MLGSFIHTFSCVFVYFEWNDKLTASYTSRRRLRIGIVFISGVGHIQKFKNDMLMGKGVQLVRYSERRLVPHDICCSTYLFFFLRFVWVPIVHSLPKIVKTFNCVKNRSHLYADDRYGECGMLGRSPELQSNQM